MQLGESFIGTGVNAAHVNIVLGSREGPVATAWATALATPSAGHTPFVVTAHPNLPVQPFTLFVNKATIASERHASLTWGAAQAGVARGVIDALVNELLTLPNELLVIAAVWVNPDADDEQAVYANNRDATYFAITMAANGGPTEDDVVAAEDEISNAYFTPPPDPPAASPR